MSKFSAKWFPKSLNVHEKCATAEAKRCKLLKPHRYGGRNLGTTFTDSGTKQQSIELRHPSSARPKEFCVQKSVGRVLAFVFWDCQRIMIFFWIRVKPQLENTVRSMRRNYAEKTQKVAQKYFVFTGQWFCTQIICYHANSVGNLYIF